MTERITLIGKNSFLAQQVCAFDTKTSRNWTLLGHQEALEDNSWAKQTDIVINFAFHPDLKQEDYSPIKDIDFLLASYIRDTNAHYIMPSTRMVYGEPPSDLMLREDITPAPVNYYGQNKLKAEQAVASLLPSERLSILRIGNIFGFEPERQTFFGAMLTNLKNKGLISFDIAPDSQRDFLPTTRFAQTIHSILQNPKGGLYNLASGFGTSPQDLAEWLIAGYGSGDIHYTDQKTAGQFILDMNKTRTAFDLPAYDKATFKQDVIALGQRLLLQK